MGWLDFIAVELPPFFDNRTHGDRRHDVCISFAALERANRCTWQPRARCWQGRVCCEQPSRRRLGGALAPRRRPPFEGFVRANAPQHGRLAFILPFIAHLLAEAETRYAARKFNDVGFQHHVRQVLRLLRSITYDVLSTW